MGKRIKDLSRAETDGYLAVDNALNGTGKMNTSVIFNNFAGKFVPNETDAVAEKLYTYKGVLYEAKVDYNGDWDPSKFTQVNLEAVFGRKALLDSSVLKLREEIGLRIANEVSTRSYSTLKFYEDASKASQVITGGYFGPYGNFVEAEGYTNLVFAAKDFTALVYFENQDVYRQICVFDGVVDAAHFVARYRSNDGTLPYAATPLAVLPGQIFIIGNAANQTFDFTFHTTWDGNVVFTEPAVENMETQMESFIEAIATNKATAAKNEAIRIEDGDRNAEKVSQRTFKENLFFTDANKASQVITGGYYDASGNWIEASGYTNNLYGAKDYTAKVYFPSAGGGVYSQISVFEGSATSANFIARYRSSDNNLPTIENPLVILPGQIFVISNGLNSTTDFSYFTTWNGEVEFTTEAVQKILEQGKTGIENIADDEIDKNIFDITTGLTLTRNSNLVQVIDGYYGDAYGGLSENTNYISYIYDVNEDTTLYANPEGASYLSVSVTNKEMTSGVRYRQKVSSPAEYDLPTEENPVNVSAGKRLIISAAKSVTAQWSIIMPEEKWRSSFNSRIPLAQSHINQVLAQVADDRILVKYVSGEGVESSTERLEVYVPTKVGYCRYDFLHNINAERNCDCWRVAYAYAVDAALQSRFVITRSGEWECAIRLEDRDDFAGGYTHGDEMLVGTPTFLMDGKVVTLASLADGVRCKEFKCVTKTNFYDPADHTTNFAVHGCEHQFTNNGVRVRQNVEWLVTENVTSAYMAMNLPLKAYSDKFFTSSKMYAQDITAEILNGAVFHNTDYASFFKADTGVCNEFYLGKDWPVEDRILYITDNGGSTYTKGYYVVKFQGTYEISSGTNWKGEFFVNYKIAE